MTLRRGAIGTALAGVLCAVSCNASADRWERVTVPTLDERAGAPLVGHWMPAPSAPVPSRRPALVLMHGCGGLYDRRGGLAERMRSYAELFHGEGWHVLLLDSFSSRGVHELCTQPRRTRSVDQSHRRDDALGAMKWMAERDDVDPQRVALVGWSHGGSAVLAATNRRRDLPAHAPRAPRVAVAFYPGCVAELRLGHESSAPLLVLLGAADDWTAPQPCMALAERSAGGVRAVVYEGAFHGFDAVAPVRVRRDVHGGVHAGQGVHVGGDPVAREASQRELLDFLRQHLAP
ncbi:MAG TPA: prolyl oligopeptidase family serine peptidase [Burkholderiaceae bacterium]|nr:prolyl oligopeptidase family serine peptidase [Burkholderiaceae bacterium]